MTETITLKQVIDYMESGLTFSIKFTQYSEKNPTKRGNFLEYQEAVLLKKDPSVTQKNKVVSSEKQNTTKRNSNHYQNMTRNIRPRIAGVQIAMIVKIHLDLIVRFNGKKVILP